MDVSPTSCIILAGGQSSRLGVDKRRLRLWGAGGPSLLEWLIQRVAPMCAETVVVLNDPQAWPELSARLIPDSLPGSGPLGGLASGLQAIHTDAALVLACDLPLVQPALLAYLLRCARTSDALVPLRPDTDRAPRNQARAEPLLAIYRRACLPAIERCLSSQQRSLVAALTQLNVQYLQPAAWRPYDPHGLSFMNLNTPHDLTQINAILPGIVLSHNEGHP